MNLYAGTPDLSRAVMVNRRWVGLAKFSSVFLRLALAISFLSAVADRFGLWGVYGQPNVAWGSYARFVDYTAKLNDPSFSAENKQKTKESFSSRGDKC